MPADAAAQKDAANKDAQQKKKTPSLLRPGEKTLGDPSAPDNKDKK